MTKKYDSEAPLYLVATDAANLWQNCRGKPINAWLTRFDRPVEVQFIKSREQNKVTFEPFDGGEKEKGLRISQADAAFWSNLVNGASPNDQRRFQINCRFTG
ncbi:MAG: hypothetical protein ACP5I8_02235 [Phycisphaerae bacterium]